MQCNEVQDLIVAGTLNGSLQEHLETCAQCRAFARDAELFEAGLTLLAKEAAPDPSWGFSARVLRRLDESSSRVLEPFESIGRRAVLLAGALAMTVVMVMALSSSGPLRSGSQQAVSWTRGESTESAETLLAGGVEETEEINLLPVSVNGGDSR
jgi:hypothetical protein